jgi:hypothetical protein
MAEWHLPEARGRVVVSNAISLAMLEGELQSCRLCAVRIRVISGVEAARKWMEAVVRGAAVSVVGHEDAAQRISETLTQCAGVNVEVKASRENTRLAPGDVLLVHQRLGDRLPVGTSAVSDGKFVWHEVQIMLPGI